MLIAIPVAHNKLDLHFGHCKEFALLEIDQKTKKILSRKDVKAPPHQPGLLPPWLASQGVTTVIAGGIGQRAKDLFNAQNIEVIVGARQDSPENLANNYLQNTLQLGENCCDH